MHSASLLARLGSIELCHDSVDLLSAEMRKALAAQRARDRYFQPRLYAKTVEVVQLVAW